MKDEAKRREMVAMIKAEKTTFIRSNFQFSECFIQDVLSAHYNSAVTATDLTSYFPTQKRFVETIITSHSRNGQALLTLPSVHSPAGT